jgi:hypothetical protein
MNELRDVLGERPAGRLYSPSAGLELPGGARFGALVWAADGGSINGEFPLSVGASEWGNTAHIGFRSSSEWHVDRPLGVV